MKKLGKLSINPEKVIKKEELVNLRGGYGDDGGGGGMYICWCWCRTPSSTYSMCGPAIVGGQPSSIGCLYDCMGLYGMHEVTAYRYTNMGPYG